jgi:hypothetical protein
MECVYLLREIDYDGRSPTGLYKIGKTIKDANTRKRQYQAGNARRVDTLHTIQVNDAQTIETQLHRVWGNYRVQQGGGDEWFDFKDIDIFHVISSMDEYREIQTYTASPSSSESSHFSQYSYRSDWSDSFSTIGLWIFMGLTALVVLGGIANQSSKCAPAQVEVPALGFANLRSAPKDGNEFIIDKVESGKSIMVCEISLDGKWRRVKTLNSVSAWIATGLLKL